MKRCPDCHRDYYDDSLNFCLDDGSGLLDGPASDPSFDEPQTAIFQLPGEPIEQHTALFSASPPGADQITAVFSSSSSFQSIANSIAVLPFANLSSDEENEFFCDGLSEELLNELSRVEGLKAAARTSAFSFKGKNADVREIGEKLNVSKILEGSVRRAGERLRISVQLIDVADGYHTCCRCPKGRTPWRRPR